MIEEANNSIKRQDTQGCSKDFVWRDSKASVIRYDFIISLKWLTNPCNSIATICTKINFIIKSKFSTFATFSINHNPFKTN